MAGKTARSCDSCVRRPAKWYCAADDAFLCCSCDASVHSANPLSRRHHRLQLRIRPAPNPPKDDNSCPAWLRGFTRKARTPRPHGKSTVSSVVPEIETSDENNNEDGEETLLYRVPVFDPEPPTEAVAAARSEDKSSDCLVGFLPSDTELKEFNADIESLLNPGIDNSSFSIEELYAPEEDDQPVKEEWDDNLAGGGGMEMHDDMDLSRETLKINFEDCGSPSMEEEGELLEGTKAEADENQRQSKKVGLRLDYEAIISEWSLQGSSSSPWMDGERPQFGPGDCWLDYMGMWGAGDQVQGQVQAEVGGGHTDEGREARVSRYREKRRTRLFSKKIRYEVRKLNAEKRPRMRGRFVKRASAAAAATATAPVAPDFSF